MSELSSFYGGRQGISFILVKRFDAITVEENRYTGNLYAVEKNTGDFILTSESENNGQPNVAVYQTVNGQNQSVKYLIPKHRDNYTKYKWVGHLNDGTRINESNYNFPEIKAEGMVQCFEKGAETLSEVNYGEYVIIDTTYSLRGLNDPDNGKVFRRGLDINGDLAGAEYVGKIVGPQGETPEIKIAKESEIITQPNARSGSYDVDNRDLIPGLEMNNLGHVINGGSYTNDVYTEALNLITNPITNAIYEVLNLSSNKANNNEYYKYLGSGNWEQQEGVFHDNITYSWVTVYDELNNVKTAQIGFTTPYLTTKFFGKFRKPYYTEEDYNEGRITDRNLIGCTIKDENFDLMVNNGFDQGQYPAGYGETGHPFFRRWKVTIPKGIKGDCIKELKIYPTIVTAGSWVYTTVNSSGVFSGSAIELVADTNIVVSSYWDTFNKGYVTVKVGEDDYYASLTDTAELHYGYLLTWYDDHESDQDHMWCDIGPYRTIKNTSISPDGWITVSYTCGDPDTLEEALRWIYLEDDNTKGVQIDDDGSITIWYNTIKNGQREFQKYEDILDWIDDVSINRRGHFELLYNNESLYNWRDQYEYGKSGWELTDGGNRTKWQTDLTWPTQISLSEQGVLKFLYNNNLLDDIYPSIEHFDGTIDRNEGSYSFILPWLVKTKLLEDGHFNFVFNNDRLYDETDPNWMPDRMTYAPQITWLNRIRLENDGRLRFYFNNDKLYNALDTNWEDNKKVYSPQFTWITGIKFNPNGIFNFSFNNEKLYDENDPYWSSNKRVYNPKLAWVIKASLSDDGYFRMYFNNDLPKEAIVAEGGTWNDADNSYVKQITWVKDIALSDSGVFTLTYNTNAKKTKAIVYVKSVQVDEDGTVTFFYCNGNKYTSPYKIKYVKDVYIDTGENEGEGTQKLHIEFNTGEDYEIGNPINYVVESIITDNSVVGVPANHLLVWYSDPAYRTKLAEDYPSRMYDYQGTKDTTSKQGWFDLGYVKGEPGGVRIIGNAISADDLYNDGAAQTNPIKPEDIGGADKAGWIMTVGDGVVDTEFYAFDYEKNQWYSLGTINSDFYLPDRIIAVSNVSQVPSNLVVNGIWAATVERKFVLNR